MKRPGSGAAGPAAVSALHQGVVTTSPNLQFWPQGDQHATQMLADSRAFRKLRMISISNFERPRPNRHSMPRLAGEGQIIFRR